MFMETIRDAFAFIGYLGFIVALLGIGLNEILYGTWYGETEEQKRERMRKERGRPVPWRTGVRRYRKRRAAGVRTGLAMTGRGRIER